MAALRGVFFRLHFVSKFRFTNNKHCLLLVKHWFTIHSHRTPSGKWSEPWQQPPTQKRQTPYRR